MKNSFDSLIENSKSVLILLPSKPFFDQVAAGLALYLSLTKSKDVTISSPSPMTVEFNRLVGVDKIVSDLGNKNLVIKFANYDGKNVERVSADIEGGLFQLTVIPKPSAVAPQKNQIELSYSGVASDTVFLIGGANESHFPILSSEDLTGVQLAHIGMNPLSVSSSSSMTSLARRASSVSEIVASLLLTGRPRQGQADPEAAGQFDPGDTGIYLDADVATNLLMGIESNTDSFSSDTVTADTFYIASELMRAGGKRIQMSGVDTRNLPPGAIPQSPSDESKKSDKNSSDQSAPEDWLDKPKIYKGTPSS